MCERLVPAHAELEGRREDSDTLQSLVLKKRKKKKTFIEKSTITAPLSASIKDF
jgi:hypothetical protein